jgi:iron complex outermembrane receptor protein
VGAYTRTNIPEELSYGIELQGAVQFNPRVNASAKSCLSRNKVMHFTEYIDDYDNGGQKTNNYSSTDIAYSPALVAGYTLNLLTAKTNRNKSPGRIRKQTIFRQHTEQQPGAPCFFCTACPRNYYFQKDRKTEELNIVAQVNNVFGKKYEPNGYTFSYNLWREYDNGELLFSDGRDELHDWN